MDGRIASARCRVVAVVVAVARAVGKRRVKLVVVVVGCKFSVVVLFFHLCDDV